MFIFSGNSDSGYQIAKSIRLRGNVPAYLGRLNATCTDQTMWTWSGWVKKSGQAATQDFLGGFVSGTDYGGVRFDTSDRLQIYRVVGGASTVYRLSTQVFRDPAGWYHFVVQWDSNNGTTADRCRVWVNGVEITVWTTNTGVGAGATLFVNRNATTQYLGRTNSTGFDGYLAECYMLDGTLEPYTSFGETNAQTNAWVPKRYTGASYGLMGYYLSFGDATSLTTLGNDDSPNSNNFTTTGVSLTAGVTYDSMSDTPTNNFCSLNPLSGTNLTLSSANLGYATAVAANTTAYGTFFVNSDKWYWETVASANGNVNFVGIAKSGLTDFVAYYGSNGNRYIPAGNAAYGATYTTGDVIGIALDLSGLTVTFYKNNVSQGALSIAAGEWAPYIGDGSSGVSQVGTINFGQQPFTYTAPSGYLPLCSQNLPDPTIKRGDDHFKGLTWTGNSAQRDITGLRFQPDLIWAKCRSTAYSHSIQDAVRGFTTGKKLSSNSAGAQGNATDSADSYGYISAALSNGFTIDKNGTGSDWVQLNVSAATYVGWSWRESVAAGFDIVTYTGNGANRTVAHSLGIAPKLIITKRLDAGSNWQVGHDTVGWGSYLVLESTAAPTANATAWNSTAPTSSVFSLGTGTIANTNLGLYVAYVFAEVAGFSKIGGYTGNGSADGTFIWCGFRPAFVLIKRTSAAGDDWYIYDTARDTYNATTKELNPNTAAAESTSRVLDILSNGFKIRTTASGMNAAAGTYVFMAFAENPFKYSNAR